MFPIEMDDIDVYVSEGEYGNTSSTKPDIKRIFANWIWIPLYFTIGTRSKKIVWKGQRYAVTETDPTKNLVLKKDFWGSSYSDLVKNITNVSCVLDVLEISITNIFSIFFIKYIYGWPSFLFFLAILLKCLIFFFLYHLFRIKFFCLMLPGNNLLFSDISHFLLYFYFLSKYPKEFVGWEST